MLSRPDYCILQFVFPTEVTRTIAATDHTNRSAEMLPYQPENERNKKKGRKKQAQKSGERRRTSVTINTRDSYISNSKNIRP